MKMIGCFFLGLILITSGSSEDSYSNLQAPRFIKQPSESQSIVTEDRTKILQCQAAGWPKPEYRWLKDGMYLEDRNPQHQYIRISDVKRSDAGVYQCEATNPVGTILSESINLTIAYMYPFEHTSESTITVKRGRAAILSLPSIESNPPPVVTWLSDDRTLYGIRYATTPDNKLVVLAVDQRDQKSYRARATNTQLGHEETTGAFHLLVGGGDDTDEEIPEIVVPPQNVETIKGEPSTELACIANYPDIFDIETTWFKDDIPIEETEIQFQFSDSWNRTLDLILAEQSYAGIYKCKVRRKFIKDKYNSASAVVTVLEKPVLVEKVSPETAGDFGRPLSLPCESTGNPTPIVTWYRNGENIANITGHKFVVAEDGSLIINNVKTEDNGMYQCFARNKAGEATAYTWLKVKTISRLSPIARLRDYQLKERWISSDYCKSS